MDVFYAWKEADEADVLVDRRHTATTSYKMETGPDKTKVCVYSGLTSLSTIFQSYHDGVWLRQGAQCSLL